MPEYAYNLTSVFVLRQTVNNMFILYFYILYLFCMQTISALFSLKAKIPGIQYSPNYIYMCCFTSSDTSTMQYVGDLPHLILSATGRDIYCNN